MLGLCGDRSVAVGIDMDMNDVGMAADGAVFDIGLAGAFGQVQRDDDFFAAGVAQIAGFLAQWQLLIELRDRIACRRELACPQEDVERLGVGESVILSDFEQSGLGFARQIDRILKGDHVIESAMEDDGVGFD